jgi:hypothetical protein
MQKTCRAHSMKKKVTRDTGVNKYMVVQFEENCEFKRILITFSREC